MKEVLLELVNRLEQQDLKMLHVSDRLDALQQSFDLYHSEAVDDRLRIVEEVSLSSRNAREAIASLHEDLRQLISKLLD